MKSIRIHLVCLAAFVLMPLTVSAQTIHGHPQKAFYASPAEYPEDSTQCHVARGLGLFKLLPLGSMLSSHVHIDPKCPKYAETSGELLHCTGTVKLFMWDGVAGQVFGELVSNVVWDETGTSTPPLMIGDPIGLKTWTFKFDVDPRKAGASFQFTDHGWNQARVAIRVYPFAGHGRVDANRWLPFWSNINPATPETAVRGGFRLVDESECDVMMNDANSPQFGNNITEARDFMPIAPIASVWTVPISFYSYQADDILEAQPIGAIDEVLDPDFHNKKLGTNLLHLEGLVSRFGTIGARSVAPMFLSLDPATLGTGNHKVMFAWSQPSTTTGEQMSAISVYNVSVGTVPPPPPPPPPTVEQCIAQVTGTSSDGGKTVTLTSTPIPWSCR